MTPQIITDFITDPDRTLQKVKDGFYPRPPRPTMPARNFGPRRDFMELRSRHLDQVEKIGIRPTFDRAQKHEYFMANYDRLFGPLRRPKSAEVPSNTFRKGLMISQLLSLIELRREEIAANVLPGGLN